MHLPFGLKKEIFDFGGNNNNDDQSFQKKENEKKKNQAWEESLPKMKQNFL